MRRSHLAAAALAAIAVGAFVFLRGRGVPSLTPPVSPVVVVKPTLPPPEPPPLGGLDLSRIALGDDGATAPVASRRVARLTIDPALQHAAQRLMAMHHLPEAAMVLVDVATGKVLAYASHLESGSPRDLCAEATAPAASVFKIVTGAALVEGPGVSPEAKECYSGGEQKILPRDIEDDPVHDRWCTTLAGAVGHSTNAVIAKLALHHLKHPQLEAMADRFGFNAPVPFDVPVQPSTLKVPGDDLEFARTAAGFWHSTLSPLEAAWISATVARAGDAPRLSIVSEVIDDKGGLVWSAPAASSDHRAIAPETARAVTRMMEVTVTEGTAYRAFHDGHGQAFLPNVPVAGKTGTLTDAQAQRFYTWFTGFAPSRPDADGVPRIPQVAVAVLVVNKPTWRVKANVLARELLREYFARERTPGVTAPTSRLDSAVARRE